MEIDNNALLDYVEENEDYKQKAEAEIKELKMECGELQNRSLEKEKRAKKEIIHKDNLQQVEIELNERLKEADNKRAEAEKENLKLKGVNKELEDLLTKIEKEKEEMVIERENLNKQIKGLEEEVGSNVQKIRNQNEEINALSKY